MKKTVAKKKSTKKLKTHVIAKTIINISISEEGVKIESNQKDLDTLDVLTSIIYLAKLID